MSYLQGVYPVTQMQELSRETYSMWISCPQMADLAQPGQFVHIKTEGFFLRRPISICQVRPDGLRLIFSCRGEGTRQLSQLKAGDFLDLMGPLGHGFDLLPKESKVVLVGGGIGTPPMLSLAEHYGAGAVACLGFRSKNQAILCDDLNATGCIVQVATDDGSLGKKGHAGLLLEQQLKSDLPQRIYACGPLPMLRAVKDLAQQYQVSCQLSLEERMACGVGACLVCACKAAGKDAPVHVCKEGPVFWAQEVEL